jgi:hypothetical protein
MKAWLSRTQIPQRPMLAVYAGLLIIIALVIGAWSLRWLTSGSTDRLAVIGNLLSLGTLLLALVAGIVALAAYSAATGRPELKMQFRLPMSGANQVRFVPDADGFANENTTATIIVRNTSSYAARSPAVTVSFQGGMIPDVQYGLGSTGWTRIGDDYTRATLAFQWDGGPNYAIHGNSVRYLPELNLQGLSLTPGKPAVLVIRLLADGYSRPAIRLPAEFTENPSKPATSGKPPQWI